MNLFKIVKNITLFAFAAGVPTAFATPLALDYTVTAQGGLYHYDFRLTVDNNDGSFAAGNGFGWLVFGDAPGAFPTNPISPIDDFVLDAGQLPVGPWTALNKSYGGHNGPTFIYDANFNLVQWTPTGVGDFLTWSGVSANDIADGSLLFSTLINEGGAVSANFEVATRNASPVSDGGATAAMLGLTFVGLITFRRRFAA